MNMEVTKKPKHSSLYSKLKYNNRLNNLQCDGSGLGKFTNIVGGQSFEDLREQSLKNKKLFEDPNFPLDNELCWKRPFEIVSDPKFIVDGFSRFDVKQGNVGNCWFLSVLAGLACAEKETIENVIPINQSFSNNYAGIFHFRLWYYGHWIDVVIDDLLPVDSNGELKYCTSTQNNEFWSPLLEKAYTKLFACCSYKTMSGGTPKEAMEALTGGLSEVYDLYDQNLNLINLFQIIQHGFRHNSLVSSCTSGTTYNGLIRNHAYTITKLATVMFENNITQLIRLRNPWANTEWKGSWSDESKEWHNISSTKKSDLNFNIKDDGEFWMSLDDFKEQFIRLEICYLTPDVQSEENFLNDELNWKAWIYEGKLLGPSDKENFLNNESSIYYIVEIKDEDCGDDNECVILVSLKQKSFIRNKKDPVSVSIGLYEMKNYNGTTLDEKYFQEHKPISLPDPVCEYEFSHKFIVSSGTFCLKPNCYDKYFECEFVLRIFAEYKI